MSETVRKPNLHAAQLQHAFSADFFRCHGCGRIFTLYEQAKFLSSPRRGPCPCGANRYYWKESTDLFWWEWLLPRVLRFVILRHFGRI